MPNRNSTPTSTIKESFPGPQPSFSEAYTPRMIEYVHKRGMPLIRAGAAIWRKDHGELQFLLVHETRIRRGLEWVDGDGGWNIPGGCVDINDAETHTDSIIETAKREALDETGQTITLGSICHVGQRTDLENPYIIIVFEATLPNDAMSDFHSSKEIKEIAWFTVDQIHAMSNSGHLRNKELVLGAIDTISNNAHAKGVTVTTYTPKTPKA